MSNTFKKFMAALTSLFMTLALVPASALAQTEGDAATGKGSISISNPTNGQTYSVYKLFDATVASDGTIAYTGTIPEALNSVFETVPGTSNNVQVKSTAVDTDGNFTADATKTVTDYVNTLTAATKSATSDGTSPLTFQGLDYGYYAVKSSLGTVLSIDSNNPNVTVRDKNTSNPGTDADKKIVTGTDETTGAKTTASATTAKIGDTVNYQITFTAQNYDASDEFVYQYVITDNPTGLDIDTSTLQYSIVKGTGTNQYDATNHAATVTKAENGNVTITIPWGNQTAKTSYYDTPATVTITYSAKLTATEGSNKANVAYNTKTGTDTPEPKVETAEYQLTKVDSADTTKTLTGAEFDLYDASENGTQITVSQKTSGVDGAYVVDPNGTAKIKTDANGKFTIEGLKQDTNYYLQETKAPDGYTLPTARIALTKSSVVTDKAATVTENVTNTKGSELPSTGGMGTVAFTVVGAALVVTAGVLLVTRRRMQQ